jgi:hypothetical protein
MKGQHRVVNREEDDIQREGERRHFERARGTGKKRW